MKLLISLVSCCLLFGCVSEKPATTQEEQVRTPTAVQPMAIEDEEAKRENLRKMLALIDPGPLTKEEYKSLTRPPYSREPFLNNELASQMYFNGYRRGFALRAREPGQLALSVRISGSVIDAARDTGFSAGLMGYASQLTDAEKQEVEDWKRKYEEVSMWPYFSNAESEMRIKFRSLLEDQNPAP